MSDQLGDSLNFLVLRLRMDVVLKDPSVLQRAFAWIGRHGSPLCLVSIVCHNRVWLLDGMHVFIHSED